MGTVRPSLPRKIGNILVTSQDAIRSAHEGAVMGAQMCNLAVGLVAEIGGVVAGGGSDI